MKLDHPILLASFSQIDRLVQEHFGDHGLTPAEYDLARRVVHSTADFEFLKLLRFYPPNTLSDDASSHCIHLGMAALQEQTPIVVDVNMVADGIKTLVKKTFQNPIISAINYGDSPPPGMTRTATGLRHCLQTYPEAIYVIGNAPTALQMLCQAIANGEAQPKLVIGVPVGFVGVLEAKQALMKISCPQIVTVGRKGGSTVAAALVNALARRAYPPD